MNDTQEDYLSMFNVVIERCEENIALISPIPMLLQTLADFKAKVQEIKDTAMEQGTVLTGIAEEAELSPHADVVLRDIGALPGWLDAFVAA